MLTNELLEANLRAQRALAAQGGDDLHTYAQNVHQIVRDVEQQLGLKFRYRQCCQEEGIVAQHAIAIKRPQIRRLTLSIEPAPVRCTDTMRIL